MAQANDARALVGKGIAALTPHPHRGDLIAAGAVPVTLGVLLVNVRFQGQWSTGILFVLTALACALVLGMGLLSPLEGKRPRAYQQVLLLAGLVLGFVALLRFAHLIGAESPLAGSGSRTWVFAIVTLAAAWVAHARRSAICALVAALGAIVFAVSFVRWAFEPSGPAAYRWVLLALSLAFVLGALARRDVERRESVYLIDAAGVAILVLGVTFLGAAVLAFAPVPHGLLAGGLRFLGIPTAVPGSGWKLVLLAAGLGLVAYACVDREPGPAYVGALVLLVFVALTGIPGVTGASLWFWPLALVLLGGIAIGAGLRPRRELPPEPRGPTGPGDAPTQPLPGPGRLWASGRPDDAG